MIEKQTVEAELTNYQLGVTETGKEQVALTFRLAAGPNEGQSITWFGYFTDKALKVTMKALRACGMKGDDLANPGPMNQKVSLEIEHEEYKGNTRARVKWVNGTGGAQLKSPMTEDQKRLFAAKMQSKMASHPAEASTEAPDPGWD